MVEDEIGSGHVRKEVASGEIYRGLPVDELRPGKKSMSGFLGIDEDIEARCRRDDQILETIGVSHQEIAEAFSNVFLSSESGVYEVGNKHINVGKSKGPQECPGVGCTHMTVYDYEVANTQNQMFYKSSGLMKHLVDEHHFSEGRGTYYRVEYLDVALTHELYKDKKVIEEVVWEELSTNLGGDYGIPYVKAHNFLLLSCEREGFTEFVQGHVEKLFSQEEIDGYRIVGLLGFLEHAPLDVQDTFEPIVKNILDKVDGRVENGHTQQLKKLHRILRRDVGYLMIAGQFLPEYELDQDEQELKYCREVLQRQNLNNDEVLLQGRKYWEVANENRAGEECRYRDPDDIKASMFGYKTAKNDFEAGNFWLKAKDSVAKVYTPYAEIVKKLGNVDWADGLVEELAEVTSAWVVFERMEEYYPGLVYTTCGYVKRWTVSGVLSRESKRMLDGLNPDKLQDREEFYLWGVGFAGLIGNIELMAYCQFQRAITQMTLGKPSAEAQYYALDGLSKIGWLKESEKDKAIKTVVEWFGDFQNG